MALPFLEQELLPVLASSHQGGDNDNSVDNHKIFRIMIILLIMMIMLMTMIVLMMMMNWVAVLGLIVFVTV